MEVEVLTLEEAAKILRSSTKTVRNEIRKGKLNARKVGRAYRFLPEDIKAYLANRPQEQGSK